MDKSLMPNDIVAFLIDERFIVRELPATGDARIITRQHMQFMAACDLGPKYAEYANAPAIATVKRGRKFGTLSRVIR